MRAGYKIIIGTMIIGAILVAVTARPDPEIFANQRNLSSYSDLFFAYTIYRYPAHVEIIGFQNNITIGVSTNTDLLDFGSVFNGSTVKKQLNLTSKDGKASKITLKAFGTISPLISFSEDVFLLADRHTVDIYMNSLEQSGNYTGEIDVIVQRSRYDSLKNMLGY